MPLRATKFREDWLHFEDKNGTIISEWCIKGKDEFSAYCILCKVNFDVSNSGKTQIFQHSSTKKHKELDGLRKDSSQSRLFKHPSGQGVFLNKTSTLTSCPPSSWTLNEEDKICRSEIIWTIQVALCNYSFQSSDSVQNVFKEMFSDSSIPQGLQLSSRKIAYTISHGLGPYFLKEITDQFKEEAPFFTLMFDEALNEQNSKQLDIHIRFWYSKDGRIAERYLGSDILGHATALDICSSIMNILKSCSISVKTLLMVGSDGPNVNKVVFQLMDKEVKCFQSHGLLNIGTCNLHIIHNAFGVGLKLESFANVIDFLENIYSWFTKYPSRKEDLQKSMESLGEDILMVLRFVSNRWLSVVRVSERALKLLPALKAYFLEVVPKESSRLTKTERYLSIVRMLESPLTLLYLKFFVSVGNVFEDILKLLQLKTTLIHVLYDELSQLLVKLMRRFVNTEIVQGKTGEQLLKIDVRKEAVSAKNVDVGNAAKKLLTTLDPALKAEFLADAKEFFIGVTTYLQDRLPLKNRLLKFLQILHPITWKEPVKSTLPLVQKLANLLPQVVPEHSIDVVVDEWTLYVNDNDICELGVENPSVPIDTFWNSVFNLKNAFNKPRYPNLANLIKAVLTLSHGQATVERGFSVNKRALTSDRASMSLATIRGLRLIKDALKGKKGQFDINLEMIKFYKDAHRKYKLEKDALKNKVSQEKILDPVPVAKEKGMDFKMNLSSAQSIINEGNQRLKAGLKRKDIQEIEKAQALIDAGTKKLKIISKNPLKHVT